MNFKKFFSNAIVGLMTTTLFSANSFAMETASDKKIVVINNETKQKTICSWMILLWKVQKIRLGYMY